MQGENNQQVPDSVSSDQPTSNRKQLLLLGAFLLGMLVLGFLYAGFFSERTRGALYLTLAPLQSLEVSLYSYDLESKSLARFPIDGSNMTAELSPDGRRLAYIALNESGTALYITDLHGVTPFKVVDDNKLQFKRMPQWSSSGETILFNAQDVSKGGQFRVPEDWSVYMTDLLGTTIEVAKGAYPLWGPNDSSFLLLRNDGLYLQSIPGGEANPPTKVWEGENVRINMKLGLSSDKKWLAWSSPNSGEIVIFEILSWSPFQMKVAKRLDSHSFWVAFSPDGRYLAAQEVDWENLTTDPKPRIVLFDLEKENEKEFLVDLSEFNQQAMFLTDWR